MFIVLCNEVPQEVRTVRGRKAASVLEDAFDRIAVFATKDEAHTVIGRTLCRRLGDGPAGRITAARFDFRVVTLTMPPQG